MNTTCCPTSAARPSRKNLHKPRPENTGGGVSPVGTLALLPDLSGLLGAFDRLLVAEASHAGGEDRGRVRLAIGTVGWRCDVRFGATDARSEGRREGEAGVRTGRSRWWPYNGRKK